ncbi:ubiquitin carboxyl-terminal hydrolase 14 [Arthroderma uncinatum]|uniref:ubiquitin carboxyl-terminal hydrolase 14 n=1 Tax=Arthroderma uncinatum TaxID=74035 RepID=UPI00144ADF5D|nr:ubiquitin carboxyl-terminal hydrolase 14 [Arthroderma uncinatum]KAF3492046.1 ubiquitin carboxyl-terminal hydrolase 14 [Arthroderma uncinatum]
MMACVHIASADLSPPTVNQSVYREDCTQCFDSIDNDAGLNVCLHCFNGGCAGERGHGALHTRRHGHPLALNIKRTRKQVERAEPPVKMSKLAIEASSEDDQYDVATKVVCLECGVDKVEECSPKVLEVVDKLMQAPTFSRKEEVKAWEQELTPCEHTLTLEQGSNQGIRIREPSKCYGCDLQENLWLCLECGTVGCGRAQFGGVGGNSHALAHSTEKSHSVAVKLRSITPEGSADIYCYTCNDEKTDPELAQHISHWGLNIAEQEKTEKSLTELQIEQNLKWDFSMTSDDGKVLNPVFGPELTGLKNLGNSCYMASVLQCLFSLPEFKNRYFKPNEEPPTSPTPAEDLETQLRKIADGLLSGRYSVPDAAGGSNSDVVYQHGISPSMFKHLIGRGHPEFSTMRQQDAFELLLHLFKIISVSPHSTQTPNPVESFRFAVEQRLQCTSCRKVRYKVDEQDNISVTVPAIRLNHFMPGPGTDKMWETVPLKTCIDMFTREENVELTCSGCGNKNFSKRSLFKTLPQNLVVNARRWEVVNYVPMKLDIPVEVGKEPLDLTQYLSLGKQDNEELLADDAESEPEFVPNSEAYAALLGMGFPENRVKKALHNTGNSDQEAALNWILAHMDDPSIDEPMASTTRSATGAPKPSDGDDKISQLADMGIPHDKAEKALGATDWDVTRALDWVFSHPDEPAAPEPSAATTSSAPSTAVPGSNQKPALFDLQSIVCHKGTSVHAGHYVAFIRKHLPAESEPKWILFNDEKVVAEAGDVEEMKQFAYIYIFRRV